MAYMFQVTFDSSDPHAMADWWAAALGWEVEPSNEAFIRQMIDEGQATDEDTTTHNGVLVWKDGAAITHPDGGGGSATQLESGETSSAACDSTQCHCGAPRMLFQLVPEPKTVKNRVHLDVRVGRDEVAAVVARLTASGATVLHEGRQGPHTWMTLADPWGNEVCIT